MANLRIFKVQSLTTNAVAVGGVGLLGVELTPMLDVASAIEGAVSGPEVHDYGAWAGNVRYEGSDAAKLIALLTSTPGSSIFQGVQSGVTGAAAWAKYTLATTIWTGGSLTIAHDAIARLSMQGMLKFAAEATNLESVVALLKAQTILANTQPDRYYRLDNANFTDYTIPVPVSVDIAQPRSLTFGIAAQVLRDFGDADIGETAIDIVGWQQPTVSFTFRDSGPSTAPAGTDRAIELIRTGAGVLTADAVGIGGVANGTITINNLKFGNYSTSQGEGFTDYTVTGKCAWFRYVDGTGIGTNDVGYALSASGDYVALMSFPT